MYGANKYIAFISNGKELSASAAQNIIELESHDQVIVSSECTCTNSEHMNSCEIVHADFEINNKNKRKEKYIVEVAFCKECGAYFIPQNSFNFLRKKGDIIHAIKGGVILYELIYSGPEFQGEKRQLEKIKRDLVSQISNISRTKSYKEMLDEADSSIYCFQTLKFENDEIIHKKRELEYKLQNPYHGRIDIGDADNPTTYYIGGAVDQLLGGVYIHSSWSEIGKLFYDTDNPQGYINGKRCDISLRRRIRIVKSELQSIENTFSSNTIYAEKGIYDKFLIQVLQDRKKSNQLTDIIATIQKQQNRIIEKAYAANIIVQGCAGSGKTMVMLHRLSYWLYNNKSLRPEKIKIITPNENFNIHINMLHAQLKLDEVEVLSVARYYCFLLSKYSKEIAAISNIADEENVEERFVNYIYSKQFLKRFNQCFSDIIKEYISPEDVGFVAECASKCEFNFDLQKYPSDGDLLVALASIIRSIYQKDESAKAQNTRIQNQINKNNEINALTYEEKQIIFEKINQYKSNYKEDLKVIILNKIKELNSEIDEIDGFISEIEKDKKNNDSIGYYFEHKFECIETRLQYESVLDEINSTESIDDVITIMESKENKNLSVVARYIGEYRKQKSLYNDKNSLMKKNEKDIKNAEKKTAKTYLTNEENERINNLIEKYPVDIDMCLFNKVYDVTIEEKLKEFDIDRPNYICRFELYARLIFAEKFWNKTVGEDEIICIDEGQDLSYYEYELIINQNKKNHAYYSIYGDLNQRIKMGRGMNSWEQLATKLIATEYKLNENYRNTNQVTRYCNESFDFEEMLETGVDGAPVRHITFDEMLNEIKLNSESEGITVILLPRSVSKQRITRSNKFKDIKDITELLSTKYDITKISIMYVDEIKGIEFNKVYVMEDGMEKNEKYIAYTRSLDKLIIVH